MPLLDAESFISIPVSIFLALTRGGQAGGIDLVGRELFRVLIGDMDGGDVIGHIVGPVHTSAYLVVRVSSYFLKH